MSPDETVTDSGSGTEPESVTTEPTDTFSYSLGLILVGVGFTLIGQTFLDSGIERLSNRARK